MLHSRPVLRRCEDRTWDGSPDPSATAQESRPTRKQSTDNKIGVLRRVAACLVLLCGLNSFAQGGEPKNDAAKPNSLTQKEIADGWLLLFDGETTFGWRTDGGVTVKDGWLRFGGDKPSKATYAVRFRDFELRAEFKENDPAGADVQCFGLHWKEKCPEGVIGKFSLKNVRNEKRSGQIGPEEGTKAFGVYALKGSELLPVPFEIVVPANASLAIRSIKLRPLESKSLFNGKDLSGWHEHDKKKSSKWTVEDNVLRVRNGPGDLQTDEKWADFVLQADIKTHGKALNSGIFFRCIPGDYQNGYEAQIQNAFKDNDRTKPADFGTGAIYRRVPTRKVVANDEEWFTMTVAAQGNRIATWVNGYMTVDWTDERPPHDNPRNGSKTGAGAMSLQGHDPTTDISFRNLRVGALPADGR